MSFEAGILSLGIYAPEKVVPNSEFCRMLDTSEEWIRSRTGILERRFVEPGVCTSDLASLAALNALAKAKIKPEEIDLLIVATATPDHLFPSTACIVQGKIGAYRAAAFDLSAGCSGFIYALCVAAQLITTGSYRYILVIGAETLSKFLDMEDRSTCVLMGDGAGAMLLGRGREKQFLCFRLEANGQGGQFLELPAGGSYLPASRETVASGLHYIKMQGREVFKWAVEKMSLASLQALRDSGLKQEEIDLFVPHQANLRIIVAVAERLAIPIEKVLISLHKYGNTSAASIPLTIQEGLNEGKIRAGTKLLLAGFGAGFTWGSVVLRWPSIF